LQALLALLHAECPLHELTPSHFTFASSALAVVTTAVENITAAAAANATLDIFREFIRDSPKKRWDSVHATRPVSRAFARRQLSRRRADPGTGRKKACIAPRDRQALGGSLYAQRSSCRRSRRA
jgi:hypothetical protein